MKLVEATESRPTQLGKRVLDDLYVHTDYIADLCNDDELNRLIQTCLHLLPPEDLRCCNVAKINVNKQRVSFLQYLAFDEDPFPTLNGSWVVDPHKGAVSFRSYSSSLNPPILHSKELLVPNDHPKRVNWETTTKAAEELGLFSSSSPIGFRENWLRLISERGFRLEGQGFIPIGNQIDAGDFVADASSQTRIQRHLTALTRNSLSAPIQLLIGHGLISYDVTVFDYGCGRGDDLRGLGSLGIRCSGWDPHYAQDTSLNSAEIVNLGFVVNVIEDAIERVEAIQKAFALSTTALVASVMLHSNDRPGKPYRDGYLTARNTFQKYFSQDEFKDLLEQVLEQDPIMIGPGIALVFSDKDAEQRFLLSRYRSTNVARRLLGARLSPRIARAPRAERIRVTRVSKSEREFSELRPLMDDLWKAPYKNLEPKLRFDIRYFFVDYKRATEAALRLLLDLGEPEIILEACKEAAANGFGWLDDDHSLQLHVSLVERLPVVLRAYISCGLLLWDNIGSVQLIKIHIGSGKLTLLQYDNFDDLAIPLLVKRVKVTIRKLDYDVFDYQEPQYPPSPLLFKSRYMHEDMAGYAEQAAFDEQLESTGIVDQFESHPTWQQIEAALEARRMEIDGISLKRSSSIPSFDQQCGANFSFRNLIECGETQIRLVLANVPRSPATYNALYDLCTTILDPVVDYFGGIRLTYGFSSPELTSKIQGRIAPKLDQHASHECNRLGRPVCDRLGAAVDFIVDDEDMLEVAQWVVANVPFDRLYYYGKDRAIHVSISESPVNQVTLMLTNGNGRQVPKTVRPKQFLAMTP